MELEIVPATVDHVREMAPLMREADVDEAEAIGETPESALLRSLAMSSYAWSWIVDGRPAAMFGVGGDVIGVRGVPWLATSAAVERHRFTFLRHSRAVLERMRMAYPQLENYVDARYERTVRWLEWLGFRVHEARPFGPRLMPFRRFTIGGSE